MRGKRPTRRQKEAVSWAGLNVNNWLVKQVADGMMVIEHRESGRERRIPI